ncbi:unnamed protein product, partial [Heterotrigona itama]
MDRCVRGVLEDLAALRPDIVVSLRGPSSSWMWTVPFDNTYSALERARLAKIEKYAPLALALSGRGYSVYVDGFVVVPCASHNEKIISLLRVSSRYAALMRRLMVSETVAWSRDMYVEYVTGVRQYSAPGSAARDAATLASTFPTGSASVNIAAPGATIALEKQKRFKNSFDKSV